MLLRLSLPNQLAYSAFIQACVLSGSDCSGKADIVLMDVNPLTMGIETSGGVMAEIVRRGTSIPTKKSQIFSTAVDNQPGK